MLNRTFRLGRTAPVSLRTFCEYHEAIAIRTMADLEHDLAEAISAIADWQIPGFGRSDCSCTSHLFGMQEDPFHSFRFIKLLQYFRMDRLEVELAKDPYSPIGQEGRLLLLGNLYNWSLSSSRNGNKYASASMNASILAGESYFYGVINLRNDLRKV
ncbi:DUF123 domain-containing protein [Sporomusa aerivorans]|uniref:DUF123 domain-containing protein n=1 Tax=Sporomusa aerivorans TaxID=204936 RepID=UPI00352AEB23